MNDEDEIGNWGRGLVPEGLNESSQAIYCLKFIERDFRPVGALRILLRSGYIEQPRSLSDLKIELKGSLV